jgi:prolipoprotein diacylglyceryl transferase
MTTTYLAYFPSPPRGVWHLGPVPIRAYAVFIIIGIVVALLVGDRRWEARGGDRGVIYDIALWAVPFGLVGGRLYHLSTDWRTYFGEGGAGVGAALRIWDGGLGIWGAVALGGVGAWIACRRRGIPLPAFGDAVAPGIVLAQAIGRLGNYFNQELFGRETTLPWGLEIFYRRDPSGFVDVHSLDCVSTRHLSMVVHPTFLYEMLWNIFIFVVLIYLDRRFTIGHGRLFALYVAGYCVGRFGIELLRSDAATHIAGIRINSFTSTFVFIGAVVYFVLAPKGREDPLTLRGTRRAPEELPVPEPASELASVASASGAVAATSVAGRVDEDRIEPVDAGEAEVEQVEDAQAAEAEQPEAEAIAAEAEAVEGDVPEAEMVPVEVDESVAEEHELPPPEPEAETLEPEQPEGEAEAAAVEKEPGIAEVAEPEAEVPEAEQAVAELAEAERPETEAEELPAEPLPRSPSRSPRRRRPSWLWLRWRKGERPEAEAEELHAEQPESETEAVGAEPDPTIAEVAETEAEMPEADQAVADVPEIEQAEAEVPEGERPEAEGEELHAEQSESEAEAVGAEPELTVAEVAEPEAPVTDGEAQPVAEEAEPAFGDEERETAQGPPSGPAGEESTTTRQRWRTRLRNLRSRSRR